MRCAFDGVELEYETNGKSGSDTVIFLHGWGGDLRSFGGAYAHVSDMGIPATNIAFPKEVPESFGIYDYAALIQGFIRHEGLENITLVGHSFGGRVATILASQHVCKKLILVDSAGMRPRLSIAKKLSIARYKRSVKRGKPLDGTGSVDYNNTKGGMRKVFTRIVNTHLEKLLSYIECPTLIVWGRSDRDTPPYMARRLLRGIKNSRLEFIDGGHYGYIRSSYRFYRLLDEFIS